MNNIIIIGAAGCGREVANWIEDINNIEPTWNILGFLDDNRKALEGVLCKYPIIGTIKDHEPKENIKYAMGIANPEVKKKIGSMMVEKGAQFVSIIHPSVHIYSEFDLE